MGSGAPRDLRPGSAVLEMNCGTGEDALWLARRGVQVLATDVSPAMLEAARKKLAATPDCALARFHRLAWEELETLNEGPFDGMLSNFGGLNCVGDLRGAARDLAAKLRPHAVAIYASWGRSCLGNGSGLLHMEARRKHCGV